MRVKEMLVPSLMSGVGVMGYIGPFFVEYNLNPQLLPVQYPATYAHEMAHVLGVSNEAEANYYGYRICISSSVREIRFSGYFSLLGYVLSNAYSVLDEEAFESWKNRLRPEIRELYNQKSLLAFPLQSIHRDSPRLDIQCLFEGKWNIFWDSKLCGSDSFDYRIRAEVKTQKVLTGGFRMDEKYYLYGLKKKNTVICFVTYGD